MGFRRTSRKSQDRSSGVHIPVRGAESGECGNENDSRAVRYRLRKDVAVGRVIDQFQFISEPLDRGTTVKYTALQGICGLTVQGPGRRCDQTLLRDDRVGADIHEREAAGAVSVLDVALIETRLSEKRCRLITQDGVDTDTIDCLKSRDLRAYEAEFRSARKRLWEHAFRDMEVLAELVIPCQIVDIEEHRSRGIGVVGRMGSSACQTVEDPGVDCSEEDVAESGTSLQARHLVQDPLDLRRREIRVRHESGLISDLFDELRIRGFQFLNEGRRSSALPDDRVIDRSSRVLFPQDRGLTLVRDTDAGNFSRLYIRLGQSLTYAVTYRSPEVLRIVFDPARLRIVLVKGLLRRGNTSAVLTEDHGAGRCRSLINRKHVLTHRLLLVTQLLHSGQSVD